MSNSASDHVQMAGNTVDQIDELMAMFPELSVTDVRNLLASYNGDFIQVVDKLLSQPSPPKSTTTTPAKATSMTPGNPSQPNYASPALNSVSISPNGRYLPPQSVSLPESPANPPRNSPWGTNQSYPQHNSFELAPRQDIIDTPADDPLLSSYSVPIGTSLGQPHQEVHTDLAPTSQSEPLLRSLSPLRHAYQAESQVSEPISEQYIGEPLQHRTLDSVLGSNAITQQKMDSHEPSLPHTPSKTSNSFLDSSEEEIKAPSMPITPANVDRQPHQAISTTDDAAPIAMKSEIPSHSESESSPAHITSTNKSSGPTSTNDSNSDSLPKSTEPISVLMHPAPTAHNTPLRDALTHTSASPWSTTSTSPSQLSTSAFSLSGSRRDDERSARLRAAEAQFQMLMASMSELDTQQQDALDRQEAHIRQLETDLAASLAEKEALAKGMQTVNHSKTQLQNQITTQSQLIDQLVQQVKTRDKQIAVLQAKLASYQPIDAAESFRAQLESTLQEQTSQPHNEDVRKALELFSSAFQQALGAALLAPKPSDSNNR